MPFLPVLGMAAFSVRLPRLDMVYALRLGRGCMLYSIYRSESIENRVAVGPGYIAPDSLGARRAKCSTHLRIVEDYADSAA